MIDPADAADAPQATPDEVAAYEFASPSIRFGEGRAAEIGDVVRRFGRSAWLVTGRRHESPAVRTVVAALDAAGVPVERIASAGGEPTVADVVTGLAAIAHRPLDAIVIVAVGGGSAIDLAKAVAALSTNGLEEIGSTAPALEARLDSLVVDHLEGVGKGLPIRNEPLPVVAVPTTAGTGAEATRNAVISCPERRFKKSLRSPLLVPRVAVVDPLLSATCPRSVVAACGIDCITQLIESYICRFRRPLTRAIVSLPLAVRWAGETDVPPEAARARAAMSHAALCSGIALANSGLGLAHGVAAALGIECGVSHGVACGLMLPVAMEVNLAVAVEDFAELERLVDPSCRVSAAEAAARFVRRIEEICGEAGIPRNLVEIGLTRDRIEWLAANSGGGSMRGNPVELSTAQLAEVLAAHYD
jgi:alcohol dehydrogenase class IV